MPPQTKSLEVPARYARNCAAEARDDNTLAPADAVLAGQVNYLLQAAVGALLAPRSHPDFYKHVPISTATFLALTRAALQATKTLGIKNPAFLDVGCGLGTTLLLAQHVGFNAHGFDRNKRYTALANAVTGNQGRATHADARTFPDYHKFDTIYWYNPIANTAVMRQVELKIATQAKTPTLLASAFDNDNFAGLPDVRRVFAVRFARLYLKSTPEQHAAVQHALTPKD